ncbi:MAG: HEAT repeat domain-containing protein [Scytolyngbya sp. HA4215-MV1]|nr:HEAT repeat domain-containing protein [Scytolyngbya sp. HA4215-MV1]
MGFFSRLIRFFIGNRSQNAVAKPSQPPSPSTSPSSAPSSVLTAKPAAPELETPPIETLMHQVAEVRSSLAEAAQAVISSVETLSEKVTHSKQSEHSRLLTAKVEENITLWGNSKQVQYVPQLLRYANHSEHEVQSLAVNALGKIAKANPVRVETQQMIPVLAPLLHSQQASVRQAAIVALGEIQSERVLPLLQSALRNSSGDVAKAASVAIKHLKWQVEKPQPVLAKAMPKRIPHF